jgi:UrcA family protein
MNALFTAIALSTLVSAAPAAADTGEEAYSIAISFNDLDVARDSGAAALLHRVKANADRLCVGVGDSPLQQLLQAQQCRINFIRTAEGKLWLDQGSSSGMRIVAR